MTTIISLMKQVPLPSQMRMGEDGLMDRTKAKSIINVDCSFALEAGLQLRSMMHEARLIVCSMGPPSFEQSLKTALAMGYDEAYLLSDRKLGGSDTFTTGLAISKMLRHLGFGRGLNEDFIVVAGRQTSDGDTAHVPSQVAENLDIPQATFIEDVQFVEGKIIARRIIEGGYQILKLPVPCTLSLTPTGIPPRRPTLAGAVRSRASSIKIFSIDDINMREEDAGLIGSPTIVAKVANIKSERAPIVMSTGEDSKTLVKDLMHNVKQGKNHLDAVVKKEAKAVVIPEAYETVDFRKGASGILTWAEVAGGKIARSSLELLTPARHLAESLDAGTKVRTVLIGSQLESLAQELIAHGSDEVIVIDDARLSEYRILPFSAIFAQVIKAYTPEIALFAATTAGRELAPRIGVKTQSGVTADCTALEIGVHIDNKKKVVYAPILESRRPTYGESKLATILGFVCPQISTARAGTFEVPTRDESRIGLITPFTPQLGEKEFVTEILETVRGEGGLSSLFEADVIVTGGRGAIGDEMALVKELSSALKEQGIKCEWAVSRPVVDLGLCEYARQIGQTGKTVRPKVYIAVGVSGAIQHIAGMKEAETIVAINHNAKESIFSHADFGIVGEYEEILPELIEAVKNGFVFGLEAQ
ncbi:MAG: FAD-binding protein [Sulfurospirillaceae bacterium]|nr:FAD-binding protein [Sulfurospirillaceae bacterium]MDD2827892.1 FAD-binding protein [Sulfurospirillaceae bacterium]